jgi:hypothetical protein
VDVPLVPGSQLGPYRLEDQVGRGGMGVVFKGYQAALARFVAVKVLPEHLASDEAFQARFRDEAIAIAGLRHPNIIAVFDYGQAEGSAYIVTEYVDGGTLHQQLGSALPVGYTVEMLAPIAAALDYAHSRGVIHRDVKPANILVGRDGRPMLSDFGLARMVLADRNVTTTGLLLGTPNYMAPEQARGEPVGASDQYALGVVAYEMLTGRVPFSAPTPMAVVLAHQNDPLPPPRSINPDIPEAVEAAVRMAMDRDPAKRFRSATHFVRALSGADTSPTIGTGGPPSLGTGAPIPAASGSGGRRTILLAAGGLVALAVLAVAGYFGFRALNPVTTGPIPPVTIRMVTWEQWKKIPGILDVQATSNTGQMLGIAQGKLILISRSGQIQPFAQGQNGFTGAGGEPYIAVSPGLRLPGCDFNGDDTFALHQAAPFAITRVDNHGNSATQLAAMPGLPDLNGLAFDTGGRFGQRLLVVSDAADSSTLSAVDCKGQVTRIAAGLPKMEGGLAVAPNGFGVFGGNLVGPDEFDGKIYAIDENGRARVIADSRLPSGQDVGVESAGFVPPGFIDSEGAAYVADRASPGNIHPGTDTLLRLGAAELKAAGVQDGDLLVATEGGGRTIMVRCRPDCTTREVGHASDGAHVEGHILFLS